MAALPSPRADSPLRPPQDSPGAPGTTIGLPSSAHNRFRSLFAYHLPLCRFYTLEIVQQPIRARMCGFGDKVRPPLFLPSNILFVIIIMALLAGSATACASRSSQDGRQKRRRLSSRRRVRLSTLLLAFPPLVSHHPDPTTSDIDTSFFIATADLWDSDGHREMNLVLHPTSSDRYVATQPPKRRRGTNSSSGPSFHSPGEPPNTGPPPLLSSPDNPPYDPPVRSTLSLLFSRFYVAHYRTF